MFLCVSSGELGEEKRVMSSPGQSAHIEYKSHLNLMVFLGSSVNIFK